MAAGTTAYHDAGGRGAPPGRRAFDGTGAVLIFQPGEEGFAGASAMIDDGLFGASRSTGLRDAQLAGAAAGHHHG